MASRVAIWPLEKQRRSRINWRDLLPKRIAIQQEAYERRATVAALVNSGMSFRAVAVLFGISSNLAGGFYHRYERYQSIYGDLSPAEIWLSANASDWLCV